MADPTPPQPQPPKAAASPTTGAVKAATPGAAAAKPKKAAQPKKQSKGKLWTTRLQQNLKDMRGQIVEVFRNLRSPDAPTRRMARFFVLSLAGLALVSLTTLHYVWVARHMMTSFGNDDQGKNLGEFLQRQADEAHAKNTAISLGSFTVELKALPDSKPAPGVMNLAEIELTVQCDSREACTYVSDHLAQAKNQITGIFIALNRDDLLSHDGKKRLVRQILDRLNEWLPQGRIDNLFFSKLVVS
jgi:flagellar basal body-associated protein FliL